MWNPVTTDGASQDGEKKNGLQIKMADTAQPVTDGKQEVVLQKGR
jgi:hypothetical protein